MNSKDDKQRTTPIRGYLEGYYGKLLSWSERGDLLQFLNSQRMSTYCYAPKEDTQHRLHWREEHNSQWHTNFAQFCTLATNLNVCIVAGIAPGLDFNFDQNARFNDFDCLHAKANSFLKDGAHEILIMWDDIDDDHFIDRDGFSEGTAHARVINRLSDKIGCPLWTVPRVYAAEIENKNNYLEDFFAELNPQHTVLLCGTAIVARNISTSDLVKLSHFPANVESTANDTNNLNIEDKKAKTDKTDKTDKTGKAGKAGKAGKTLKHRTVVWDNFYANDYCPRRLFLGPWTGREQINDYLLNPTGLPYTDKLLLDIAATTHTSTDIQNDWENALKRHGVPDSFLAIAPYFTEPFFGDRKITGNIQDMDYIVPTDEIEHAIEECLWKWKTPLAREWYPYIFGLKHDIALSKGVLPRDRVLKTQTTLLAKRLLQ